MYLHPVPDIHYRDLLVRRLFARVWPVRTMANGNGGPPGCSKATTWKTSIDLMLCSVRLFQNFWSAAYTDISFDIDRLNCVETSFATVVNPLYAYHFL